MSNTGGPSAAGADVTVNPNSTGLQAAQPTRISFVVANSAGAITVAATPAAARPHDNMPPWLGVNFIIRYM